MLPDLFTNLLASLLYDLLKTILPHPPRQEDLLRELRTELRRQSESLHALQAVLTRFGGQRVVNVGDGVSGSIIITGDGNQVIIPDEGLLAQRWQELQLGDAEVADLYCERSALSQSPLQ